MQIHINNKERVGLILRCGDIETEHVHLVQTVETGHHHVLLHLDIFVVNIAKDWKRDCNHGLAAHVPADLIAHDQVIGEVVPPCKGGVVEGKGGGGGNCLSGMDWIGLVW